MPKVLLNKIKTRTSYIDMYEDEVYSTNRKRKQDLSQRILVQYLISDMGTI